MQASKDPTDSTITVQFTQDDTGAFAMAYGQPEVSGSGEVTFNFSGRVVAKKGIGTTRGWKAFLHECFSFARSKEDGSGAYPKRDNPFGRHEGYDLGHGEVSPPSWPGRPPTFKITTGFLVGNLFDGGLVLERRAQRLAQEPDVDRVAVQYAVALRDVIMQWFGGDGSEVTVHWGDGLGEDPKWLGTTAVYLGTEDPYEYVAAVIDVRLKIDAVDLLVERLDAREAASTQARPDPARHWWGG